MINQIKAEQIKLKSTRFFWIHLLIPLAGILCFSAYFKVTHYALLTFSSTFFSGMALCYPMVIAVVCEVVFSQEMAVSNGYWILSAPSRSKALTVKLVYLLGFSLLAGLFTTVGLGVSLSLIANSSALSLAYLVTMAILLWSCAVFSYFLHTWLALKAGRNVNLGVATFELLVSALLMTGLGDGIWPFFPNAWGARVVLQWTNAFYHISSTSSFPDYGLFGIMFVMNMLMICFVYSWFQHWDGRNKLD
ncbi:lantibiotic immunity ABC transporter MutG family permease subunit [uncultured Enterococcus sp.]|uniref:lantibiotic immunity ABC transporter MutG family permease subunit n=1 Tax=uncultured Enterococcus sp. TaxID=167972 RepID=UPI0025937E6C|nr:lantibiotic immunity ABC transporter MutG family permease subunit [uncultured Enterococcus sp.]